MPENANTVNLKSASIVVIMLLQEGLTPIKSQIKPRLLFGESFTLTWMAIKCNRAALKIALDRIAKKLSKTVKTSNFIGVVKLILLFYRFVFQNVSFSEKVPSALQVDVITPLCHDNLYGGLIVMMRSAHRSDIRTSGN